MTQKIVDYTILDSGDKAVLVSEIKFLIEEGWQPYGFLTSQGEYQYTSYTQALVKYEQL